MPAAAMRCKGHQEIPQSEAEKSSTRLAARRDATSSACLDHATSHALAGISGRLFATTVPLTSLSEAGPRSACAAVTPEAAPALAASSAPNTNVITRAAKKVRIKTILPKAPERGRTLLSGRIYRNEKFFRLPDPRYSLRHRDYARLRVALSPAAPVPCFRKFIQGAAGNHFSENAFLPPEKPVDAIPACRRYAFNAADPLLPVTS
jgi:hypothetical protein